MTDRLNSGQGLQVGESLGSPDGRFSLTLQPDGNLVLYDQDSQPVWASATDGQEVSSATMQEDGNLVLNSAGGDPVWASDTYGNDGAYLVLQDDRNVVIYNANDAPLWATDTIV
jgi:outer membrane protein assembly factor BamB